MVYSRYEAVFWKRHEPEAAELSTRCYSPRSDIQLTVDYPRFQEHDM